MSNKLSPNTLRFLTEWYGWATDANEKSHYFDETKSLGLCSVCGDWISAQKLPYSDRWGIRSELSDLFLSCGLAPITPFGADAYFSMLDSREDVNRTSWVKAVLKGKLKKWKPLKEIK